MVDICCINNTSRKKWFVEQQKTHYRVAKWEDFLEEGHLKKILTVGGVIAVAIGTSYIIKAYLDVLRIKLVKKELKELKSKKNPVMETPTQENWILEDE